MKKAYKDIDKSVMAMAFLKSLCIDRQLVRCDECCFAEPSNNEHNTPFCMLFTIMNRRCNTEESKRTVYYLKEGTVPKECKFWISLKKEIQRIESTERIRCTQHLIDKLTPAEKKKIKL